MGSRYRKTRCLFLIALALQAMIVPGTATAQEARKTDAVRNAQQALEAPRLGPGAVETKPAGPYTIGCILPLTGAHAAYGSAALEAIMLATGIFDPLKRSPFRLMIEDSRSEPQAARRAAQKLAGQSAVICILGPLGSAEALEAAQEAQQAGVPILTLTQNEDVTAAGNYVFRYFSSGRIQIRTLVNYAVRDMGITRFAVLYPEDDYGREMMKIFREEVIGRGGQIKKAQPYDKTQADFERELASLKTVKTGRAENGPDIQSVPESAYDFDALFIPDSFLRISMIVPQLVFHDLTGIHLLGTGAWNSPELLRENSAYLEGAVFTDDFYPDSFYPEVNDFIDAFYAAYGREPKDLEALVYDAAGIAVKIMAGEEATTKEAFRNALARSRDFPGVTGRTSVSTDRGVEKNAFLLTIKNGQITQVK